MSADIVIDDGTNPVVNGSVDRDNSFIGTAFTLSNFDDTGVLAHRWTLKDKPIGSSASLTSGTAPTTQITPDIPGGYLVQLDTYLDAGATDLDDSDVEEIGVRFEVPFNWLVPAAGETIQQDSARGWATSREESIRTVRLNLLPEPTVVQVAGPVTATHGALVLYDPTGGTFTVNAPATPTKGERWAAKNVSTDITGITIDGNGNNIENPATSTLVASFSTAVALGIISYIFDGTNWVVV
jgi:hypothetical protein